MKKLLIVLLILSGFAAKASAQTAFNAVEFDKNLNKTGKLCDVVYSLKIVSDTLTLLNMGGAYPNQKYTIAVKGNKITLDLPHIKGKQVCVTGVFEMYRNEREVAVAQPEQIDVH